MIAIPDYIQLSGDEDGDVTAICNYTHPDNPNGFNICIATYGYYEPGKYLNTFALNDVNGFLNAIIEHCATHE
jgi:hypothetical protein